MSSHRPSHPVGVGVDGEAVCERLQMAIDAVVGLGVSNTAHDGDGALVIAPLQSGERGMEREAVCEGECLARRDGQVTASLLIRRVRRGDDRVQAVVAAVEGDHDEGSAGGLRVRVAGAGSVGQ